MKRCPECRRDYLDDSLLYCLEDGTALIQGLVPSPDESATAIVGLGTEPPTRVLPTSGRIPETGQAAVSRRKSTVAGLIGIVAVAALGLAGYFYYGRSQTNQIGSIAVLPFENRSGTTDADYLSDGLADSLIYRLTQLPNLKVSPTSSVMRYKGRDADVAQIAKELNVDAVLSGRLVQRNDDLNISVQLIDARSQKLIWAEQYDRKMSDLLATQREIASTIADKLQLKLSGSDARGITKKYTNSNEAYQLYLKASYYLAKRTKPSMLQAVDYYRQAIALDPSFALAYVRIADVYLNLPAYPYASPSESIPQGKSAVEKALEIDPDLPEAHTYMGYYLAAYEWKWAEAEREFKRAIELDPNSADAHFRYGQAYLGPIGHYQEAVGELQRALELEPLNINIGSNLAAIYTYAGQSELAIDQACKTYDLEQDHPLTHFYLGLAYDGAGRYGEAIALSEKVLQGEPTSQMMLRVAGYAYAMSGRRADAERVIEKFAEIGKTDYVMAYWVANIYAALGDKDKAFAELEKAYHNHEWELHRLKADALMAPIRDDPRYAAMLKRLSYPN